MPSVFTIIDSFVEEAIKLDPMMAIHLGLPASTLSDFSSTAAHRYAALLRNTLATLDEATAANESERIASAVARERLTVWLEAHEAGDYLVDINILASPAQSIRMIFDLLPLETKEQRHNWAELTSDVPQIGRAHV